MQLSRRRSTNISRTLIDKEMKRIYLVFLLLCVSIASGSCQARCDLKGNWLIKEGTLTPNYQRTGYRYSENRVTFLKNRLKLASGFFYSILSQDSDNWALGRYPFVYYGNVESYRIMNDTLQIYSRPYNKWESFKIVCIKSDEIRLRTTSDTVILARDKSDASSRNCSIKNIKIHVHEEGLGLYANNYKVAYSKDDKLTFQQLSDKEPNLGIKNIKLKAGAFEEMCERLGRIDLAKLKNTYSTGESELEVKDIEIEMTDGKKYEFHLENNDYPEELMLALVPVLYGHQQYIYGKLPVVK
jgi:hypothetical protein